MAFDIATPKRDLPRVTPRRFDRDNVFRLCAWGGSALIAAGALVLTTQAEIAGKRLDALTGATPQPAVVAQVPPRAPEKDPETLRLLAEVRSLTADRERLAARFAALEHQLEDVTGSIQRQAPRAAAPSPAPTSVAAVTTVAPAPAAITAAVAPIPTIDPLAMPAVTGSIGGWPDTPEPSVEDEPALGPAQAPKLEMREVPPAPTPLAALSPHEPSTPTAPRLPARVEYGIDLGSARNMDALRERWTAIKANLGPLLTGLQPIAVRDRKPGSSELRLVVGPMPNLAAARQVCTRFTAAHVSCRASKFDGEAVVQR